ncbi:hypothetical protein U879_08410 [Defluviimonas sp. 20V17]|nr:hypothetical protein U879_08410 [Defluviimonas sp. 20V17]
MRDRAAEAGQAQLQEGREDLAGRSLRRERFLSL